MAKAIQKITLSSSRDIPFDRLLLSQSNVRRVKAGVSVEELAEDIARRGLLQGLNVRPVVDADGIESGMFEIPAGGRRYRALQLLVKQKRLPKTAPIPCIVREHGVGSSAEEDSLAENVQRVELHPLDQFHAFKVLADQGLGDEDIAARFFVTPAVVRQRLRLAAVSPKLLDIYAEDGMTLQQLMAFTVTSDHERQERVWEALAHSYSKEAYAIRRQLTEGAVRAADRRARFVGIDAYEAAGGTVLRDLFESDDGGWLQDAGLLDRLATDKLQREAEKITAEGWNWVEVGIDFPYGHTAGLRRLAGEMVPLTDEEIAGRDALRAEFDRLEEECAEDDDLPEGVDERLAKLEAALEAFETRPTRYEPIEIARAGAFVGIDHGGELCVERGFIRPEDETAAQADEGRPAGEGGEGGNVSPASPTAGDGGGAPVDADSDGDDEETDVLRPLSDRLVTELTVHRTLALRDALAAEPQIAFQAVLHVLCLATFYQGGARHSCLEVLARQSAFNAQPPGLAETASARTIEARHQQWSSQLPDDPADLWQVLEGFDSDSRSALFAHCAGATVNVVREPWNRRPDALAHGDRIAEVVGLDMVAAGWRPTVDNYLGRVTKAQILAAVREARGERAAARIEHLKKPEMAKEAESLLADVGWLPEPLRSTTIESGANEFSESGAPMSDLDENAAATEEPHLAAAE